MINPNNIVTYYLRSVYNVSEFAKTVKRTIALADKLRPKLGYDTIAFTGTSGAAVAYILSAEFGIPLVCIRKKSDNSHYSATAEGYKGVRNYLIVDDFIKFGDTVSRIVTSMHDWSPTAKCSGILLYASITPELTWEQEFSFTNSISLANQKILIPVFSAQESDHQLSLRM